MQPTQTLKIPYQIPGVAYERPYKGRKDFKNTWENAAKIRKTISALEVISYICLADSDYMISQDSGIQAALIMHLNHLKTKKKQ